MNIYILQQGDVIIDLCTNFLNLYKSAMRKVPADELFLWKSYHQYNRDLKKHNYVNIRSFASSNYKIHKFIITKDGKVIT